MNTAPKPHSEIHRDIRRPGRLLLAVWCWCGRFYTLTHEEAVKSVASNRPTACPDPACALVEAVLA